MRKVLVIAGSDSGAGAGIQADLRTLWALGVYGTTAITAVTAQNTRGVFGVEEVEPETVVRQIQAVLEDIGADSVKTGMMSSPRTIEAVARTLRESGVKRVVVDPVMVAASGHRLLREEAVGVLTTDLIPLAQVVTPNLDEAAVLAQGPVESLRDMRQAAREIHRLGPQWVLIKGGHLKGDPIDILFDGESFTELAAPRIPGDNSHGTGCTYASAISAYLARGLTVTEAARRAKEFLTQAIRRGIRVGRGAGQPNQLLAPWASGPKEAGPC